MIIRKKPWDVIVIGSGGAGLRAGIGSALDGADVLVMSRGKVNRSGATLLAGANISADIACDGASLARLGISDKNRDDSKEAWFHDLVLEGFYLNNQKMVELFVETAADRVEELIGWGLKVLGMEGPREISVYGSAILDALYGQAKKLGVHFVSDTMFTDAVTDNGAVCGVTAVDLLSGEIGYYPAKAVVLATGGAHGLFPVNSGPTDLCGEGQAAALRAGCGLVDMEMISYCPTVMTRPTMFKGNILPYILFSVGYGQLTNKFGKPFIQKYLSPRIEKMALESEWNKMLLSYALQREIDEGRGNRYGGVNFHIDRYPPDIFDELYRDLPALKKGVYADIMRVLVEGKALTVLPAAHYFEGGILVDEGMSTGVPGLFAAGECAGGMFGANRVSAATTEMLVEGAEAGKNAARFAASAEWNQVSNDALKKIEEDLLRPFGNRGGEKPQDILRQLRTIAGGALTVLRREETLASALSSMKTLQRDLEKISLEQDRRQYNRQWHEFLALRNMSLTAGAILQSALQRRESRGVHIRQDYFITDDTQYLYNIIIDHQDLGYRTQATVSHSLKPKPAREDYVGYIEAVAAALEGEA